MRLGHNCLLLVLSCMTALPTVGRAYAEGRDVSGTYDNSDGTVHMLTGQGELYVSYSAQFGADHSCTCLARAHSVGASRYEFDKGSGFTGTAEIDKDGETSFDVGTQPDCCGSGWRGMPDFSLSDRKPPTACTVVAAQAHFYADAGNRNPQKKPAYVMKNDTVEVVPAPGEWARHYWLGRFAGAKKTTIGLIKKEDVSCLAKK